MNKKEKLYMCIGQNFVDGRLIGGGICGDVHTLRKWLEIFFPNKQSVLEDYFTGWTDRNICEYIYKNCGARLEKIKK